MKFNNDSLYISEKDFENAGNDFALAACRKIFGESAVRESDGTITVSKDYIKPLRLEVCDKNQAQYYYRSDNKLDNSHPEVYLRRIDSEKETVFVQKRSISGFPGVKTLFVFDKMDNSVVLFGEYKSYWPYEGPKVWEFDNWEAQSLEQLEIWLIDHCSQYSTINTAEKS